MDWIAIALSVIVTSALVVYITWPWRAQRSDFQPSPEAKQQAKDKTHVERREAALTALRDLDFDYGLGKVAEEDYGSLR